MTFPLEYPIAVTRKAKRPVQTRIPAPVAILGVLVLLVSSALAQHESASAGSSSSGHASVSAPSAATFSHASSFSGGITSTHTHSSGGGSGHNGGNGHRMHHGSSSSDVYYYPYYYAVPFPYVPDTDAAASNQSQDEDDDSEYQGGPTVFDRRGSGAASYVPPTYEGPAHADANSTTGASGSNSASNSASNSDPEPPQPLTALVFKDGRLLEIENYAIVNQTLYDLTPGHPRKIALADLDLAATEKQNDDRGITFQLPPSAQGN